MIIDVIVGRSPLPSFSKAEISFDGIQPAFELLRADLKRWEESTVVSRTKLKLGANNQCQCELGMSIFLADAVSVRLGLLQQTKRSSNR
jgi:hypothetical protein